MRDAIRRLLGWLNRRLNIMASPEESRRLSEADVAQRLREGKHP